MATSKRRSGQNLPVDAYELRMPTGWRHRDRLRAQKAQLAILPLVLAFCGLAEA